MVDEAALDSVASTVLQILAIVLSLRDPDADVGIVERLRREASLARTGLGFAPSLIMTIRGRIIDSDDAPDADADLAHETGGTPPSDDAAAVERAGMTEGAVAGRSGDG